MQKLFEKQYELDWHTLTGDPDQFSFYGFCNDIVQANANADANANANADANANANADANAGGENVMTYQARRAHVISRLYHAQQQLLEIRHLTFQELCPPVYVRTTTPANEEQGIAPTWKKWIYNVINNEFTEDAEENVNINWIINDDLRAYITGNSKPYDNGSFANEDNHLYWAVLEEDDETLAVKAQVYVGKTKKGIKNRWLTDSKSHCKRMKLARDVMCRMANYDPTALQSEQLVNLRLLLHKAYNRKGKNSGLFIMNYNGSLREAKTNNKNGVNIENLADWKPTHMKYGMNG
jgi:hypothetical protein